jgi:hypothetical protein
MYVGQHGQSAMVQYHDREWSLPVHDDRKHFEFLVLGAETLKKTFVREPLPKLYLQSNRSSLHLRLAMVVATSCLALASNPESELKMRRQNLGGNGAVEPGVLGAIDFAHSACAEAGLDSLGANFSARD